MKNFRKYLLGAGLLVILGQAPGCAIVNKKINSTTENKQENLKYKVEDLMTRYQFGINQGMPELIEEIKSQIPREKQNHFYVVEAIEGDLRRRAALTSGDQKEYRLAKSQIRIAARKMRKSQRNSGLIIEDWLNYSGNIDDNRQGYWTLQTIQGDAAEDTGDLETALRYFQKAEEVIPSNPATWQTERANSERNITTVKKGLEKKLQS